MTAAFVLGNGVSRKNIDLNALKSAGKVYGCNALYREFAPDVLVATDPPISECIQNNGYALTNCFYTRDPLDNLGANPIPEDYYTFSSGPAAVGIAADAGHAVIYLIGFDMGPDQSNRYNNVYADTEFYLKSGSDPIAAKSWIAQLVFIAKKYPNTQLIRVVGTTTAKISQFESISNFAHLPLNDFDF
jgi:hypothetical protein